MLQTGGRACIEGASLSLYRLHIVKTRVRRMSERKTEVVNLRMSPRVKELLREAAGREHRTLSNMLEVLIEGYFDAENHADVFPSSGRKSRATSENSTSIDVSRAHSG